MSKEKLQKIIYEAFSTLPPHAIREIAVDSYMQLREEMKDKNV